MNELIEQELYKTNLKNFYFKAVEKLKNVITEIDRKYIDQNFSFDNFLKLKNYSDEKRFDELINKIETFEIKDILSKEELNIESDKLVMLVKEIKKYESLPEIYDEISNKIEEEDHYNQTILRNEIESFLNKTVKSLLLKVLMLSEKVRKHQISNVDDIIERFNSCENLARVLNMIVELYLKLNEKTLFNESMEEISLEKYIKSIEKLYSKVKEVNEPKNKRLEEMLSDKISLNIKIDKEDSNIYELYEELFIYEALEEYDELYEEYFVREEK